MKYLKAFNIVSALLVLGHKISAVATANDKLQDISYASHVPLAISRLDAAKFYVNGSMIPDMCVDRVFIEVSQLLIDTLDHLTSDPRTQDCYLYLNLTPIVSSTSGTFQPKMRVIRLPSGSMADQVSMKQANEFATDSYDRVQQPGRCNSGEWY